MSEWCILQLCGWFKFTGSFLQPGTFSWGALGSSYWSSKWPEELRAVPLPSAEQRILVLCWVAAAAERCRRLLDRCCSVCVAKDGVETWASDVAKSLGWEEFQNSDADHRLPGADEHADEWVVKRWSQQANRGNITSLVQRVQWDASARKKQPQGFLSSGSTEGSCR